MRQESNAATGLSRRSLLFGGGMALTGVALTGCAASVASAAHRKQPVSNRPNDTEGKTFIVFGDSLTAGKGNHLVFGLPPVYSWLGHLDSKLTWVGGAAVSGATAAQVESMRVPTPAADLAIYFFGTNDRRHGRSVEQMAHDLIVFNDSLPRKTRPTLPCFVAIGPQGSGALSPAVATWNAQVRRQAAQIGWGYLDPWRFLRANQAHGGLGQWSAATTHQDPLHPTVAGSKLLARGMEDAVAGLSKQS
jgi:lysophospholipase L1-like esterase